MTTLKVKIRMYANDTLVYSPINTIDELQKDLSVLEKWKWSSIHQNVWLQTEGHLSSLHITLTMSL